MSFARAVWKLLVGIKDALVLLLLLLFFALLYAGLRADPRPLGKGVLLVDLDGSLVEQPSRPGFNALAGGGMTKEHRLSHLVEALDAARDDDRVKAVALDLDGFLGGGQAAVATLGEAVDRVRKAGKPVLAFATGYTDDGYQLAAHASEIWMSPMGAVAVTGPGGTRLYYKGLLDRLGVTANIYRVGDYKSAVEPYQRSDMSPEARDNANQLAGALLETWRDDIARARPQAAASLARYMADPVAALGASGGDLARAATALKLVDRTGERRAFEVRLAELGGKDKAQAGGFARIRLKDYLDAIGAGQGDGPIGIVTVAGTIVDGRAGPGTAGGDSIARLIEKGVASGSLKALVVRIDSPGGSVTASERIRQALLAAKASGLPVVASMGSVAASGGYWVAMPADHILAEPSTVTGSIGVFGVLPSFEGSLAKLGIGADGVKTTPLSGEPDLLRGPSPAADALIQASVESTYRRFLGLAAASRRKSPGEIDRIAQGRVWDGGTARQLGLVDAFGGLDEAVAKAAALARLGDERGVTYLEDGPSLEQQLLAMLAGDGDAGQAPVDALAGLSPGDPLADALAQVRQLLAGPTLQALCLECPPAVRPAATAAPSGLRAWLGWLAGA